MMIRMSNELEAFKEKFRRRQRAAFLGTAGALQGSLVEGSPVTGSPGQPVDEGNLKESFIESFPDEWEWKTETNAEYAQAIEEGEQGPYVRADGTEVHPAPMTLRSEVGGFNSLKLTRAGFQDLVDDVVREIVQ